MTVAAFVLALCAVFAAVIAVSVVSVDRTAFGRRRRAPVMVTLKTGDAFRGVLADHDRAVIVLRNAESVTGDGRLLVDGELIIERSDVRYVQRL